MIRFWLSLYRRRNDPGWRYTSLSADATSRLATSSVRIVRLPYDHEANGDFR